MPGAAPAGPLARRCGRIAIGPADRRAVPPAILPPASELLEGERGPASARARVLVGEELADAFRSITAAAPRAGWHVAHTEYEGVDAEIALSGAGGIVSLRLTPTRRCPGTTEVVLSRSHPEG